MTHGEKRSGAWWAPLLAAAEKLPPAKRASALANVAGAVADRGGKEDAAALAALALDRWRAARAAGDAQRARDARAVLGRLTPRYHAHVATDPVRLAAWDAALRASVRPGMRVLDIGTGCGILALLAARAGADVVGCERDVALARVAEEIVALNGLSHRVRIVAKPVEELEIARDLGGPADLAMGEIFGDSLFDFEPFALIRAAAPLLAPDARVIPGRASLHAALASLAEPRQVRPSHAGGFDLSPLLPFAPTVKGFDGASPSLALRGPAVPLVEAALPDDMPEREGCRRAALASDGGTVDGVAVWLRLELTPGIVVDAAPGAHARGFYARLRFHAFEEAIETAPGHILPIEAAWDGKSVTVTLAS